MSAVAKSRVNLILLPEVERRTTIRRATIYRLIKDGSFPRPVKIGRRIIGWVEEEIDLYIESRVAARDKEEGVVSIRR
jgi:prophage regulatory protein